MSKILIKFSHGIGDAVQASIILQHLKKYRPSWDLSFWALRGKHSIANGYCSQIFHDQMEQRPNITKYDKVYDLDWWENYKNYDDKPSTKATQCLEEVFRIPYDPECGSYRLNLSSRSELVTADWLKSIGCKLLPNGRYDAVILHYEGNTSASKKNLRHEEAYVICSVVRACGYVPVILDWDRRSPLPDSCGIACPKVGGMDLWGGFGSGDAERITALIMQSSLFIGVDSGPQKCAGATDTPSIGVWIDHHPIHFFDLSDNFLHLLPNDLTVPEKTNEYFQEHYRSKTYKREERVNAIVDAMKDILDIKTNTVSSDLVQLDDFVVPAYKSDQSAVIALNVYYKDEYQTKLRPKREGIEYVVDVGANIGAFAKLWKERNPQAEIACVEVCPEVMTALRCNVGSFASVFEYACTYEKIPLFLLNAFSEYSKSTGGSRVVTQREWLAEKDEQYTKSTKTFDKITLEEICRQREFPRIDVLKLDCEGSEFSILRNCDLSKIGTIFVEAHGAARWQRLLKDRFQGWDIGHMGQNGEFGIWHLVNPNPPS